MRLGSYKQSTGLPSSFFVSGVVSMVTRSMTLDGDGCVQSAPMWHRVYSCGACGPLLPAFFWPSPRSMPKKMIALPLLSTIEPYSSTTRNDERRCRSRSTSCCRHVLTLAGSLPSRSRRCRITSSCSRSTDGTGVELEATPPPPFLPSLAMVPTVVEGLLAKPGCTGAEQTGHS